MTEIEVFADVGCPFAHMGLSMLVDERARRESVRRETPGPGLATGDRQWQTGSKRGRRRKGRSAAASQLGTGRFHDFDGSAYASTFLPAMELTAAAFEADPRIGEAVALEVRDLTFEQSVDVADSAVLVGSGRSPWDRGSGPVGSKPGRSRPGRGSRAWSGRLAPLLRRRRGRVLPRVGHQLGRCRAPGLGGPRRSRGPAPERLRLRPPARRIAAAGNPPAAALRSACVARWGELGRRTTCLGHRSASTGLTNH